MSAENINELIKSHPLWEEYEETVLIMKEIRLSGDPNNTQFNIQLDLLEARKSDLTVQIGQDLDIADSRRGNHFWFIWDEKWKRLRTSKNEGRYEDEETIWEELKEMAGLIDLEKTYSTE